MLLTTLSSLRSQGIMVEIKSSFQTFWPLGLFASFNLILVPLVLLLNQVMLQEITSFNIKRDYQMFVY